MKCLLNLFCLIGFSTLIAQPFPIGHRQLSLTDPARPGRNIGVELYYPATISGDNVPVASGQFPVVVFGHGFLMVWSSYQPYWENLVPEGYILAFPTTEGTFSPSHAALGADLSRIRAWLASENSVLGSIWENHIAQTSAVMGHSMGGGASFLALAGDTAFTTLIGIAAAETNPSAILAATSITKPVLILAGGNDCVTPIPQHQQPMYDTLNSVSKCLITVTGGSHCQFATSDFFCNTGESTCQPAPAITPAVQQALTFQGILPWLNFYLKGDCTAGPVFQQYLTATSISVQQEGFLNCNAAGDMETAESKFFIVYPNPSDGRITIDLQGESEVSIDLLDAMGRQSASWKVSSSEVWHQDLRFLPVGIYWIQITDKYGRRMFCKWNLI